MQKTHAIIIVFILVVVFLLFSKLITNTQYVGKKTVHVKGFDINGKIVPPAVTVFSKKTSLSLFGRTIAFGKIEPARTIKSTVISKGIIVITWKGAPSEIEIKTDGYKKVNYDLGNQIYASIKVVFAKVGSPYDTTIQVLTLNDGDQKK